MQKQLESRILEVEKAKQQDQEERRKAMNDVEKQVRLADCTCVVFSSMSLINLQLSVGLTCTCFTTL